MKKTKEQEAAIAVQEHERGIQEVPDYIKRGGARGMESVDQDDIIIPRLSICQALTPQRKKSDSSYIEGLDEGDIFNTVTSKVYGQRITLIPLFMFKNRIKFKQPMGSGIDCMSSNGIDGGRLSPTCASCPHSQFTEDNPPECLRILNFAVVLPPDEIAIISMKSTSLKVAKKWNSLIRLKNADMFAGIYTLESVPETKAGNSYFQWSVSNAGWASKEVYLAAEQMYKDLRGKNISIDPESMAHEGESADNSNSDVPF